MKAYFYTGIITFSLSITAPAQANQDISQKPPPPIQLLIRDANMVTELCNSSYDNDGEIKSDVCTLKNTILFT